MTLPKASGTTRTFCPRAIRIAPLHDGAMVVHEGRIAWLGARQELPRYVRRPSAPRRRRPLDHTRTGGLPHAPGLRRPARGRVRAAPARGELRGHRAPGRGHPVHGARHASGERGAVVRSQRSATRGSARRGRHGGGDQVRLRSGSRQRAQAVARGASPGTTLSGERLHHVSRRTRPAPRVRRPRGRLHRSHRPDSCCPRWRRKGWWTRSTCSASASRSRSSRPSASSRPPRGSTFRSRSTPSSSPIAAPPGWQRATGRCPPTIWSIWTRQAPRRCARRERWRCCCPAPSTSCARPNCLRSTCCGAMRCPIALATDMNPGSSPTSSLLLTLNMACTLFRMTVAEALAGVTRHAARALGQAHRHGPLEAGPRRGLRRLGHRSPGRARLLVRPQSMPLRRARRTRCAMNALFAEHARSPRRHTAADCLEPPPPTAFPVPAGEPTTPA